MAQRTSSPDDFGNTGTKTSNHISFYGKKLREYLGFRHLFRKRYGFELDWVKMKRLLLNMTRVFHLLEEETKVFFKFIESQ